MVDENNPSSTRSRCKWEFFMYLQYTQYSHQAFLRDWDLIPNTEVIGSTLTGIDYGPLFREILYWGRWFLDIPSKILPPFQGYNFKLNIILILLNTASQLGISETIFTNVITACPPYTTPPPEKNCPNALIKFVTSSCLYIFPCKSTRK